MYKWAASALSDSGRRYLDAGLSRLDEMPLGWTRDVPAKPKAPSVVRKAPTGSANPDALNALLRKTWLESDMAPVPDHVVEMPGGWEEPDLPKGYMGVGSPVGGMSYWLGNRGGRSAVTSIVSICALAVDAAQTPDVSGTIRTETCGRVAASAWLLYQATGDERFIDVAVGIRDLALRSPATEGMALGGGGTDKLFLETFECWLGRGSDNGCYSGL